MPSPGSPPALLLGTRRVDLERRVVEAFPSPSYRRRSEPPCRLTRTETAILRLLAANAPATVRREALLRSLWNLAERSSRTLDTHVTRLRRKVEDDPSAPRFLLTVYRVGYRLELPGGESDGDGVAGEPAARATVGEDHAPAAS